jgi:hypothetical protein
MNDDAQSSHIADNVIAINQTGFYIMWFISCDAELAEVQLPLSSTCTMQLLSCCMYLACPFMLCRRAV